jgi:hypothetical protein
MSLSIIQNATLKDLVARGGVFAFQGIARGVRSSGVPAPIPPTPPPVINYSYLFISRGSGNFIYTIYNTLLNTWTYTTDSGYDSTFTFSQIGFVGNKFYTLFTKSGITYLHFINLEGSIVQSFNLPSTNAGFGLFFSISNVLFAAFYANSTTQIGHFRYEPFTNTVSTADINVTSYNNYFATVYYNLILIRYRISESPVIVTHALWPINQSTPSVPVYNALGGSPGIFTGVNTFGSITGSINNNSHFGFNSDGQSIVPSISGTFVQGLGGFVAAGAGPTIKGRQMVRIQRGNYNEYYIYDYNSLNTSPIYVNSTQRITTAANMAFGYVRTNTYTTGLTLLPSNSIAVSEQNSSSYTNAITLSGVITTGNYTDISGSVVGGRTFSNSRIAYNTYYQEPTFGYITGNSDNPVTTLLYMTNGSTWIQASGTISSGRSAMTVDNSTGTYSLNKFFTVETLIPILEPNDSVLDLPVASNLVTQRAWNTVNQTMTSKYFNPANALINQGLTGMLIRPKNTTSIVRQIEFTAGDDATSRDPLTFTLEGSNDNGVTYTTIVANSATNINGTSASRYFKYYSAVFANSSAYSLYRLTFPTLRSSTELQLQKVQFLADSPAGYLMDGSINASITLNRNQTYHFKVNAPNDIFWIQTVPAPYSAANVYNTGVTNNGCKSSILTFTVDAGSPSTLYYVSQTDPTKTGTINIVNSGAPAGNISGTWWVSQNYNATQVTWAEIWFTVENSTQWGTSGITLIQDLRPSSATPNTSYNYVVGISGQNYLFGKMNYLSSTVGLISSATITSRIQEYVLNLNLFNTFSAVSFPKLYTHITPTIAYSLPSRTTSVLTDPNGFGLFQEKCITFNLTTYNNPIIINRIGSRLISVGSQTFNIYYRNGGVQHISGSPPEISAANGWTQVTFTGTPTAISGIHNSIFMLPINLGLSIPAGTTFGFAIHTPSNVILQGNSFGSTQQFFENNDFRVTTGDNAGYSTPNGPTMPFSAGNFTPQSFSGIIEASISGSEYNTSTLSTTTFNPIYRYGDIYTLQGNEIIPRRYSYPMPKLFTTNVTTINYNNKEYIVTLETDLYNVYLRIIKAASDGSDVLVTIRSNMIFLPSTFSSGANVNAFGDYCYVDINYVGTRRDYVFIQISTGTIVASGFDTNTTFSSIVSYNTFMRLNSNNTITMFRNGILETYTATTVTNIVRMRSDTGVNDPLFAYSLAGALAMTNAGYTVVPFPVALTTVNATILANNYLILIQTTPLRIYSISSAGTLYTYVNPSIASSTLIRRLNTDTTMMAHLTYLGGGGGAPSTTYTFRMTDSYGDGWNGATMQIRQGTTVIQTIGSTFTAGSGPVDITVNLTAGVSYNLFWNAAGSYPEEVGVEILNPSLNSIYQMSFNSQALVGTTLHTFTAQSLPGPSTVNLYVVFDTATNQFNATTVTNTVSSGAGNFIYQPA